MTASGCTAVVVRWRGGEEVVRCVRSLLDHGGSRLDAVLVVDSGSQDGGAERLAESFPEVDVIALPTNRSFAWAADHGVASASSPHILLLNPDTEITPGVLDLLAGELDARPAAAGTVPLLVGLDGALQTRWQLRRLPTPARLAAGLGGAAQFPNRPPRGPTPVEQPAAAAWLIRRSVWAALDGLDPTFAPAWWEDVDFSERLLRRNRGVAEAGFWAVPEARVVHAGGASLANLTDAAFLTAYYRNLLRFARRHHGPSYAAIRASVRIAVAARALARPSRRAAYRAALRAMTDASTAE